MTDLAQLPPPDLALVVERYAAELSPRTRAAYATGLRLVRADLGLGDDVELLRRLVVLGPAAAFVEMSRLRAAWLDRGLGSSSIAQRLTALRALLRFARRAGLIVWTLEVPSPRPRPVRDSRGPTPAAYDRLLGACRCPQDEVLVRLLGDRGLRIGEVLSLRRCDVERAEGSGRPVAVHAARKGHRGLRTRLTVHGACAAALGALLAREGAEDAPLLTRSRSTARGRLESIARRAGVRVRPHGLRHSAATRLREAGVSIDDIGAFLSHRSSVVTRRYLDREDDRAEAAARRLAE